MPPPSFSFSKLPFFDIEASFSPQMVEIAGGWLHLSKQRRLEIPAFKMGKYLITQAQWKLVMGTQPSYFSFVPDRPVESVSWEEVAVFIKRANQLCKGTFRFPTEAEWEFAARGGNFSLGYAYAGSDCLEEVGWYRQNSEGKTHPVADKKPNELGLYDMSGNVWEWCQDPFGPEISLPKGVKEKRETKFRALRGGAWAYEAADCQTQFRYSFYGHKGNHLIGFRLASDIP